MAITAFSRGLLADAHNRMDHILKRCEAFDIRYLKEAEAAGNTKYARMERWPFPFAPHDMGQYPKANGQRYGGGETSKENQMPVEECGNMILLAAGIAPVEDPDDFNFLFNPVYQFVHQTPDRIPLTDWYWTETGEAQTFKARSVVGGVLMRVLHKKLTP